MNVRIHRPEGARKGQVRRLIAIQFAGLHPNRLLHFWSKRPQPFAEKGERVQGIEPSPSAWKALAPVVISTPIRTNLHFSRPLTPNG
jgi:hypothetical protein